MEISDLSDHSLFREGWIALASAPVDFAVIEFPRSNFQGEIIPALARLVETNTIRIIDVLLLIRDEDGTSTVIELSDLPDAEYASWDPLVGESAGLFAEEDALAMADAILPSSSAALLLYENVWAQELADTIVQANGRLVLSERIPRAVILQLESAQIAANE